MQAVLCILKDSAIPVCTKLLRRSGRPGTHAQTKGEEYYSKLAAFVYALYSTSAASELVLPGTPPLQNITCEDFSLHVGAVDSRGMLVMLVCSPELELDYGQDVLSRLCKWLDTDVQQGIFAQRASREYSDAIDRFLEQEVRTLTAAVASELFRGATSLWAASATALSDAMLTSDPPPTSRSLKADATLEATCADSDSQPLRRAEGLQRGKQGEGDCCFSCSCCGAVFLGWRRSPKHVIPESTDPSPRSRVWEVLVGDADSKLETRLAGSDVISTLLQQLSTSSWNHHQQNELVSNRGLPRPLRIARLDEHLYGLSISDRVFVWSGVEPGTIVERLATEAGCRACIRCCQLLPCRE